jgi:hypothetical protein
MMLLGIADAFSRIKEFLFALFLSLDLHLLGLVNEHSLENSSCVVEILLQKLCRDLSTMKLPQKTSESVKREVALS